MRVEAHGGGAEGRVVEEGVFSALAEDHLAGERPLAGEDDLGGGEGEGGAGTLHPRELALHIAELALPVAVAVFPLGDELDRVVRALGEVLHACY